MRMLDSSADGLRSSDSLHMRDLDAASVSSPDPTISSAPRKIGSDSVVREAQRVLSLAATQSFDAPRSAPSSVPEIAQESSSNRRNNKRENPIAEVWLCSPPASHFLTCLSADRGKRSIRSGAGLTNIEPEFAAVSR
jgi:hypothetical protein